MMNQGKWALLFVASLVVPFLLIVVLPVCFGFPAKWMPLLSVIAICLTVYLQKKF